MVKTVEKVFFKILKTLERYIPANTDLYVHMIYFNQSKIFKFLGQFRMGGALNAYPTLGPLLA